MKRVGTSPRRRRSVTAVLPAALLLSVLFATPMASRPLAEPVVPSGPGGTATVGSPATPGVARPAAAAGVRAAAVRPAAARADRPGWSFSRGALGVLVLSYVGIGAIAAAGIWSYARRGRW